MCTYRQYHQISVVRLTIALEMSIVHYIPICSTYRNNKVLLEEKKKIDD